MTVAEYNQKVNFLDLEYEARLKKLQDEWLKENAKFSIGDFICNVTGIIKVERVGFDIIGNTMCVVYYGYKYWWKSKGVLKRTKDKNIASLIYNLEKLNSFVVVTN